MNNKKNWKDQGYSGSRYNAALPFFNSGHEHQLVNTESGEQRTIHVRSNQTLDEAIKTGVQWNLETAENESET